MFPFPSGTGVELLTSGNILNMTEEYENLDALTYSIGGFLIGYDQGFSIRRSVLHEKGHSTLNVKPSAVKKRTPVPEPVAQQKDTDIKPSDPKPTKPKDKTKVDTNSTSNSPISLQGIQNDLKPPELVITPIKPKDKSNVDTNSTSNSLNSPLEVQNASPRSILSEVLLRQSQHRLSVSENSHRCQQQNMKPNKSIKQIKPSDTKESYHNDLKYKQLLAKQNKYQDNSTSSSQTHRGDSKSPVTVPQPDSNISNSYVISENKKQDGTLCLHEQKNSKKNQMTKSMTSVNKSPSASGDTFKSTNKKTPTLDHFFQNKWVINPDRVNDPSYIASLQREAYEIYRSCGDLNSVLSCPMEFIRYSYKDTESLDGSVSDTSVNVNRVRRPNTRTRIRKPNTKNFVGSSTSERNIVETFLRLGLQDASTVQDDEVVHEVLQQIFSDTLGVDHSKPKRKNKRVHSRRYAKGTDVYEQDCIENSFTTKEFDGFPKPPPFSLVENQIPFDSSEKGDHMIEVSIEHNEIDTSGGDGINYTHVTSVIDQHLGSRQPTYYDENGDIIDLTPVTSETNQQSRQSKSGEKAKNTLKYSVLQKNFINALLAGKRGKTNQSLRKYRRQKSRRSGSWSRKLSTITEESTLLSTSPEQKLSASQSSATDQALSRTNNEDEEYPPDEEMIRNALQEQLGSPSYEGNDAVIEGSAVDSTTPSNRTPDEELQKNPLSTINTDYSVVTDASTSKRKSKENTPSVKDKDEDKVENNVIEKSNKEKSNKTNDLMSLQSVKKSSELVETAAPLVQARTLIENQPIVLIDDVKNLENLGQKTQFMAGDSLDCLESAQTHLKNMLSTSKKDLPKVSSSKESEVCVPIKKRSQNTKTVKLFRYAQQFGQEGGEKGDEDTVKNAVRLLKVSSSEQDVEDGQGGADAVQRKCKKPGNLKASSLNNIERNHGKEKVSKIKQSNKTQAGIESSEEKHSKGKGLAISKSETMSFPGQNTENSSFSESDLKLHPVNQQAKSKTNQKYLNKRAHQKVCSKSSISTSERNICPRIKQGEKLNRSLRKERKEEERSKTNKAFTCQHEDFEQKEKKKAHKDDSFIIRSVEKVNTKFSQRSKTRPKRIETKRISAEIKQNCSRDSIASSLPKSMSSNSSSDSNFADISSSLDQDASAEVNSLVLIPPLPNRKVEMTNKFELFLQDLGKLSDQSSQSDQCLSIDDVSEQVTSTLEQQSDLTDISIDGWPDDLNGNSTGSLRKNRFRTWMDNFDKCFNEQMHNAKNFSLW